VDKLFGSEINSATIVFVINAQNAAIPTQHGFILRRGMLSVGFKEILVLPSSLVTGKGFRTLFFKQDRSG